MTLDALTREEIEARLSGDAQSRVTLVREAAQRGLAEAQAVFGQMLLDGVDVLRDAQTAFGWFNRAARQQHLMALNMVGRCYDLGQGVAVDKRRAAECYRVAAERGLDWAMYNYATLLALGDGVTEDKAAALGWLERAAAMGNAKAVNFVGSFHEDGWACPRSRDRAAACYAQAAAGGDFRGAFNHARMLGEDGRTDEALDWLGRAGAWGNAAFVAKVKDWLAASTVPGFPTRGIAALTGGAAC